jgi:predicted kinase
VAGWFAGLKARSVEEALMSWVRACYGLLRLALVLCQPRTWRAVDRIVGQFTGARATSVFRREMVMLVGYFKVGKTTLSTRHPTLCHYTQLEVDRVIELVLQQWPWMRDPGPHHGPMRWPRRALTYLVVFTVLHRLFRRGQAVVFDYCNHVRRIRRVFLWAARIYGYERTLIHVTCGRDEHIERIMHARVPALRTVDRQGISEILTHQARFYAPPAAEECERLIQYPSDRLQPDMLVW